MTAAVAIPPTPAPVSVRLGVPCPTCGVPLPGLLALCWRPACIRAYLTEDARYDQ